MSKSNGQPLRFACLIRVSTVKQEEQGESLKVQRKQNERDVARLGGTVAGWYGGQEHATAGWERGEVDRLIADASRDRYNAVIVATADRWSRDNTKSKEGLAAFREHGVRFFVGSTEMNLLDPQHNFILGMSAEVGEFLAAQQAKKSVESRLERLRRGIPAVGMRPPGRVWDKKTETWSVDEAKRETYLDIATRYVAPADPTTGKKASLREMADEHGLDHSQLVKNLRDKCGPEWVVEFNSPRFGISERVTLKVPELLPPELIKAVRKEMEARRTYDHRPPTPRFDYLLGRRIFCAGCGATLSGCADTSGGRKLPDGSRKVLLYYKHPAPRDMRKRTCPLAAKRKVPAAEVEQAVITELFQMFGNKAAIERAVNRAVPDLERLTKKRKQLESRLEGLRAEKGRLVKAIRAGTVTEEEAAKDMDELREREADLTARLEEVADAMAYVPDADALRCWVEDIGSEEDPDIVVYDDEGNTLSCGNSLGSWLWLWDPENPKGGQDRRALIDSVFGAPMPDGKPAGVYVTPNQGGRSDGPRFTYELRGQLVRRVVPKPRP